MEKKLYTKHVQALVDEETLSKLNRLIIMDAFENGTAIKTKSQWLRELIEDTVNYELNAKKIEEFNPSVFKQIKNK